MALDALGADDDAHRVLSWVQFLRAETGGYWTGANFEDEDFDADGELYPAEQPTWNSAAVVLAANALAGVRTHGRPVPRRAPPRRPQRRDLLAAGVEIERERAARRSR